MVQISPLTMTGIETASLTLRTNAQSALPLYIWLRVRPWTVTILTPRSSAIRASSGALRSAWSQPIRIFTVTGTSTAFTVASMSLVASPTSFINAEPASWPTTLRTGQPKLISMMSAPLPCCSLAASAMLWGSQPTSCIDTGSSIGSHAAFWTDWRVSRMAASLAIISVTLRPEPYFRTSLRNGRSVTPVIGARITGVSMTTLPILIGFGGTGGSVCALMFAGVPKYWAGT